MELPSHNEPLEAADSGDVVDSSGDSDTSQHEQESRAHEQDYQLTRDRAKRQIRSTKRHGYVDLIAYALAAAHEIDDNEPKSFKEAVQSNFSKE